MKNVGQMLKGILNAKTWSTSQGLVQAVSSVWSERARAAIHIPRSSSSRIVHDYEEGGGCYMSKEHSPQWICVRLSWRP